MARFLGQTVFICAFMIALSGSALAQDKLDQIKAVFLFKFADYVTWPEEKNLNAGSEFRLCVWGSHDFGKTLDVIAKKQKKYKYRVVYYARNDAPKRCHLIFTGMYIDRTQGFGNAFLVSDRAGFADRGGMVEMAEEDGKVKLTSNLDSVEAAGYKISARLLDIMDVIR